MKNNLIITTILIFIIAAGMSSCCKYAKVPYKSCESKDFYAEIEDWFYYDEQLEKNFINPKRQTKDAKDFLRNGTKCTKDLNSKQLVKIFGSHPDSENEKRRKIVFRFFVHKIDPNGKYINPPINITITYGTGIEETMIGMYDGGGGYFVYDFEYWTKK